MPGDGLNMAVRFQEYVFVHQFQQIGKPLKALNPHVCSAIENIEFEKTIATDSLFECICSFSNVNHC